MMTRGSGVPRPIVSPRTPPSLRDLAAGLDDEVVRPLEADRTVRQAPDLLGRVGHRQRDDRSKPPGPVRGEPGRPEADRAQEAGSRRGLPAAAVPAPAGGLLVGDGQADLGRALGEPRPDDVVRRPDAIEALLAADERRLPSGRAIRGRHRDDPAQAAPDAGFVPAGRAWPSSWPSPSITSGRSSAKAA